ncbi:YciI family protein [uncultured Croceitalea sp.]|uniref:YciI family protein n=1 Tax=uncultured Croceitalea sp. TaxID=1798908 RepID=UPI00330639D2
MTATVEIYMLLFRFTPDFQSRPTEEELLQMHQQWGSFIGNLAITEKLVSTHRLSFEGKTVQTDKSVNDTIGTNNGALVSGNMIVKANSLDEAVQIAKGSPILNMGGTVEVRKIEPMNN